MAVELMPGYTFSAKMEQNAAQEAAAAGLQSVEKLIRLLSHSHQQNLQEPSSADYKAVADVAVNKFKRFISLLDRSRNGHARFCRGPISNPQPQPQPQPPKIEPPSESPPPPPKAEEKEPGSKIYCPTPWLEATVASLRSRLSTVFLECLVSSNQFDRTLKIFAEAVDLIS